MTLLGFAVGTASSVPPINMSLDELIASRKKEAARPVNSVSNADRSIATSRAKRNAKMNVRRGITTSDKPTAMQIQKEVQTQHKQTITKKAAAISKDQQTKKNITQNETPAERTKTRRRNRQITQEAKKIKQEQQQKKAPATKTNSVGNTLQTAIIGRPPTKKAIKAAVAAMEEKGFQIPPGMQMVISFAPKPQAQKAPRSTPVQQQQSMNNNNNQQQQQQQSTQGRNRRGRGGRGKN